MPLTYHSAGTSNAVPCPPPPPPPPPSSPHKRRSYSCNQYLVRLSEVEDEIGCFQSVSRRGPREDPLWCREA